MKHHSTAIHMYGIILVCFLTSISVGLLLLVDSTFSMHTYLQKALLMINPIGSNGLKVVSELAQEALKSVHFLGELPPT